MNKKSSELGAFAFTFGWDRPEWVQFLIRWLLLSLAFHLIAGVMSVGFYDFDEHFQVMEFLSFKLGRTPLGHLAPEFFERDRSWLQPTFYELIARAWSAFGVVAPSVWAGSMRVVSAILGWMSLVGMSICAYVWIPDRKWRERSIQVAALLYCIPYIHARTASENLSGSLFFLAVSLFTLLSLRQPQPMKSRVQGINLSKASAILVGFLLGLSFSCRFQMGFMVFGFGLWCLLIARVSVSRLLSLALGLGLAIGLEVLLDFRGYGAWTFAPWNYFEVAILQGKTSRLGGVSPWWYYFEFLRGEVPLLGNLLAAGVILGWIFKPTHVLTFSTLPFVLIHMMVGHKEPRYLFPLISSVPILVIFGYQRFQRISLKLNPVIRWLFLGILFLNLGGLMIATLKPAAVQPLLHTYLFDRVAQGEIRKLYSLGRDPFELIGHQLDFYRPLDLEVIPGESFAKFSEQLDRSPSTAAVWLFYTHFELPPEAGDLRQKCRLEYSVFPEALKYFLFLPGLRLYANKSSVFRCSTILHLPRPHR